MFERTVETSLSVLLIFAIVASTLSIVAKERDSHGKSQFRPSKEAWQWAEKKLKEMSIEAKVGQLVHIGINAKFLPQDSREFLELRRQVVENKIGGIIFFLGDVYETVHLINRMQELAEIPLLISADFETGVGMRLEGTVAFPWNMAIAATGNPEFARKQGEIIARESRALGVHQVFAPVVDVNNNPNNPVINVRSYGEDPKMVAKFAIAFIEGLQAGGVIATAKHFPGHGDTDIDSHRGLPVIKVSRQRLDEYEFYPFREVIKAGVASIMVSHISLPEIDNTPVSPLSERARSAYTDEEIITEGTTLPATVSKTIVTDILKKDMGFDGLIVTDAMNMSGMTIYFRPDEAAIRAIEAGVDIILMPSDVDQVIRGLIQAVKIGRLSEERINQSVLKQLAWKYHLGLHKQKTVSLDAIDRVVSNKETRNLADRIAENSITLVKNDDSAIPISADDSRNFLFLAITNAEEPTFDPTVFLRTFRNSLKNPKNVKFETISPNTENNAIEKTKTHINTADVIIVGFFLRVRSGAKNSIEMPEVARGLLSELLNNQNKKIIGISFGNPYLLRDFPSIKTYLIAYGDMPSLQRASALALMGSIDIKGKLPITIMPEYPRGSGILLKARSN